MNEKCQFIKASGDPCRAKALPRSPYCLFHDPSMKERLYLARQRGGKRKLVRVNPEAIKEPKVDLRTAEDVRSLISETVSLLREGHMDAKISSTIGYLSQIGLRAIEQVGYEERLARIESRLGIGSKE